MLVVSGVAAVSAYEAHIVNVKAHVELAMDIKGVTIDENDPSKMFVDFGIVFPEEWLMKQIEIRYSTSFCKQTRVKAIDYAVYATPKDINEAMWGGDCMYVLIEDDLGTIPGNLAEAEWELIDPDPGPPFPLANMIFGPLYCGTIDKTEWEVEPGVWMQKNPADALWVAIDAPVFEGFYFQPTDVDPKPNGLSLPTLVIGKDDPRYMPLGVDLGVDLIVQVTDIYLPEQPGG
jgi:hypothetical protein